MARFTAMVVLPTPPLPEPIVIRFLTPSIGSFGGSIWGGVDIRRSVYQGVPQQPAALQGITAVALQQEALRDQRIHNRRRAPQIVGAVRVALFDRHPAVPGALALRPGLRKWEKRPHE